jgi:hypothetical protein
MNSLLLEKTSDTPYVCLDSENEMFKISERSLPENAIDFFKPIINWFAEYSKQPNNQTTINFELEYFNTSSAKQIAKILLIIQEMAKTNEVLIKWHYSKNDLDMKESGIRFSKLINVNFEFIETK